MEFYANNSIDLLKVLYINILHMNQKYLIAGCQGVTV